MREIVSPLSGIRSPFGARRNPLAAYAAAGFTPKLVAAFADEFYAKEGRKSTFGGVLEPTATTNGTMVDSDGLLKWRPHNLLTYSEDLTQSWTATGTSTIDDASTVSLSGTDAITSAFANTSVGGGYTIEAELWTETDVGGQVDIGFNTNNLSNTFSAPITLSATPTKYLFSKSTNTATQNGFRLRNVGGTAKTVKISKVRLYRSDLGGMVDNPDTGDSYVPTTTSAVYLPRRNHHIYNGSTWVNEGVLIEPETRTNLVTYSEDFTDASWVPSASSSVTQNTDVSPDGNQNADTYTTPSGTDPRLRLSTSQSVSTSYALSIYAKKGNCNFLRLRNVASSGEVWFNLDTGLVGTETSATGLIEYAENGFYRCTIVSTTGGTISANFVDISCAPTDGSRATAGGETVIIYGAQLEEGSTPSSYIPTSGSQVARAGEQIVLPHENISWPEPKVIGPELVTNGDFATDSDWVKATGWTISGGGANANIASGFNDIDQALTLIEGKMYRLEFDVTSYTSGGVTPYLGNSGSANADFTLSGPFVNALKTAAGVGTYTGHVVCPVGEAKVILLRAAGSFVGTIDNISVKEIEPLALSIHIQGRMTYADTGIINETVFVRWAADSSNGIVLGIDTDGADTGQYKAYQAALGVADRVETAGDYFSPGVNVPFNVASRHGSTFVNGAVDGVALTEDTTPTTFPDLETTNLELAYSGGSMVIKEVSFWNVNITDVGTEDATDD